MGKGTLDDRHPLSVGAARSTALKDADCIILLGARLNWMLHFGKSPRFNADVKIVQVRTKRDLSRNTPLILRLQIDNDTAELHNNVQSALAIQADLKTVLSQVGRRLAWRHEEDIGDFFLQLNEGETNWKYDGNTEWWNLLQKKLTTNKERSNVSRSTKSELSPDVFV